MRGNGSVRKRALATVPQYQLTYMTCSDIPFPSSDVPWNFHNPENNTYVWDGEADLEAFLKTAQKVAFVWS